MLSYTAVDLTKLPAPNVVEALDFETIFAEILADFQSRDSSYDALLESDPAYKILEAAAFRELLIRQRVNEACRAVMLAYASDSDLDQIGGNYDVERLLITPGDSDAVPPLDPVYESDADFKRRIQLSLEGKSTAGPEGAYKYHGLSANGDVKDVDVYSPTPGGVTVSVLSRTGDGTPSQEILDAVEATLTAKTVRPLTDEVTVQAANIVSYSVDATLHLFDGPEAEIVRQAAISAVNAHVSERHMMGLDVSRSGIYSALHVEGVEKVVLSAPVSDQAITNVQAAYCSSVSVAVA